MMEHAAAQANLLSRPPVAGSNPQVLEALTAALQTVVEREVNIAMQTMTRNIAREQGKLVASLFKQDDHIGPERNAEPDAGLPRNAQAPTSRSLPSPSAPVTVEVAMCHGPSDTAAPSMETSGITGDKSSHILTERSGDLLAAVDDKEMCVGVLADIKKHARQEKIRAYNDRQMDSRMGRFSPTLRSIMLWWKSSAQPDPRGRVSRFIRGRTFEFITVSVILANGIFIIPVTNYGMEHRGDPQPSAVTFFEVLFLIFYFVELCLKLWVHRQWFFISTDAWWNVFDFILVVAAVMDMALQVIKFGGGGGQSNVTFIRTCRIFKVAKTLRMFRALRFISELRLMLDCVLGCISGLFWSVMLMVFIFYFFALFFVQSLTEHLQHHPEQASQYESFVTVEVAILSLFKATSGGEDWGAYYDILANAGWENAALYLLFIVFFTVAVWNIVTSLFMEKALRLARPDVEDLLFDKQRQDLKDAEDLTKLSMMLDRNSTGTISIDEFMDFMENDKFRAYFEVRGLDIKDAELFFTMMAVVAGTDELPLETFVAGCMKLKGFASSIDLHTVHFETKMVHLATKRFHSYCSQRFDEMSSRMDVSEGQNPTSVGPACYGALPSTKSQQAYESIDREIGEFTIRQQPNLLPR